MTKPTPLSRPAMTEATMSEPPGSVLELRRGGTPFPHGGRTGEWRYQHAVRPDGPTPLDHQAVVDFLCYERAHLRDVVVIADDDLADWPDWQAPGARPSPASWPSQCCSYAYTDGCGADLVCHGAPLRGALGIAETGMLLPATTLTGSSSTHLAAGSSWGEPADYFEHVMFANGRCTAPEAVAYSRLLGRDLVPSDLDPGYPPAVRFYFRWSDLACLPTARFDGVHPVKTAGATPLEELLVAAVIAADHSRALTERLAPSLRPRVLALDVDNPSPHVWATAALGAATSPRRQRDVAVLARRVGDSAPAVLPGLSTERAALDTSSPLRVGFPGSVEVLG